MDGGGLLIDPARLVHPGDLLHEAGHLAVLPLGRRGGATHEALGREPPTQGDEISAELWSYLAAKAIGIPPAMVFHRNGYQGDGEWLAETYDAGTLVGPPLLHWMAITNAEGSVVSWLRRG